MPPSGSPSSDAAASPDSAGKRPRAGSVRCNQARGDSTRVSSPVPFGPMVRAMAPLTTHEWVLVGLVAMTGLVAIAHLLATLIRNEIAVHDLKIRVATLRLLHRAQGEAIERGDNPYQLPEDSAFLSAYIAGEINASGVQTQTASLPTDQSQDQAITDHLAADSGADDPSAPLKAAA